MTQEELKNLIGYKEDRLIILNQKKQTLVDLDNEISISKFMRSFRTIYYSSKRFLLLLILGICLLVGFTALINPNILFFNSENYKNELIVDFRDSYKELAKETFEESLRNMKNDRSFDFQNFEESINKSLKKTAVEDIEYTIRFFAVLLLLFAFVLWYIARLTKKLKLRNQLISKADSITQEIIKDYKSIIEEEEREIADLKKKLS